VGSYGQIVHQRQFCDEVIAMTPKISEDQRRVLCSRPEGPIEIEDELTRRRYVLVDRQWHERALQHEEDLAAIQAGIDDMEAGRVVPLEEVDARLRSKLGLPARS
jgi:predicted transcriptional regulator